MSKRKSESLNLVDDRIKKSKKRITNKKKIVSMSKEDEVAELKRKLNNALLELKVCKDELNKIRRFSDRYLEDHCACCSDCDVSPSQCGEECDCGTRCGCKFACGDHDSSGDSDDD